jgi:hypothetical protein
MLIQSLFEPNGENAVRDLRSADAAGLLLRSDMLRPSARLSLGSAQSGGHQLGLCEA